MSNVINWFEIPATDIARAQKFYGDVFGFKFETMEMQSTKMAMFPSKEGEFGGALAQGEHYKPSTDGTTVFFDCETKLDETIVNVEKAGGQVVLPKTSIGEWGFVAQFIDSEGNKVSLHGTN